MIMTASEARTRFYPLVRAASKGLRTFEIHLRGSEPVILMSKAELESWQETFDILNNPKEAQAIRLARREKRDVSHTQMLKSIGSAA